MITLIFPLHKFSPLSHLRHGTVGFALSVKVYGEPVFCDICLPFVRWEMEATRF